MLEAKAPAEKTENTRNFRPLWRGELAVLGLLFVLAVIFTWPLITRFTYSVPGEDHKDVWMMVWNLWWVRHAIETFQNPFQTDLLYHPIEPGLYLHTLHFLKGLVSLPVQYLFDLLGGAAHGAVAAYNFCVLLSFTLSGYGAYRLAWWLWGNRGAALLAGVAFGFNTFHFSHLLGHLNLLSTEFIPFYLLFFFKTLTEREHWKRNALVAALFLTGTMLSDLQFVLYLAIFSVLALLYVAGRHLLRREKEQLLPLLGRSVALVGMFLLLTPWFTIPLAQEIIGNPNSVPKREETIYSADFLAYFVPSPFHPLWKDTISKVIKPWTASLIEKLVFPGYTLYFLTLAGVTLALWQGRKSRLVRELGRRDKKPLYAIGPGFLALVALVFAVLSFGRRLHINGEEVGPPLPGSIIYDLPVLNISRVPSRYGMITILCVALLGSWGLAKLLERVLSAGSPTRFSHRNVLVGVVCFVMAFELFPAPYQMSDFYVAQFYQNLAKSPDDGAIFNLPALPYDTTYMEAQIIHQKPIIGGFLARNPVYSIYDGVPVFQQFRTYETAPKADFLPANPLSLDVLRWFGVHYVAVHEDRAPVRSQTDKILSLAYRLFPQGPAYQGDNLQVFEVTPGSTSEAFFYNPLLSTWHEAEPDGQNGMYRWANAKEAKIEFYSGQARRLELEFPVWSFHEPHLLELYLNGQKLPDGSREVALEPQIIRVTLELKAGRNEFTFKIGGKTNRPSDFNPGPDTRSLSIAVGQIKFLNNQSTSR
jgi:hypothetical protein